VAGQCGAVRRPPSICIFILIYSIKPYRKGQFLFYIGNEAPHHSKYTPLPPAGPRRVAGRELMRLLLLALMEAAAGHAASTQHYNVTGTIDVFTDENT
jgi:hypothetical protein